MCLADAEVVAAEILGEVSEEEESGRGKWFIKNAVQEAGCSGECSYSDCVSGFTQYLIRCG